MQSVWYNRTMGKLEKWLLAGAMIAGGDKVSAHATEKAEVSADPQTMSQQEKSKKFDPEVVWASIIKDLATNSDTGKADLENLKASSGRLKKRAEEQADTGVAAALREDAEDRMLEYDMLELVRQEKELWEKHLQNTEDAQLLGDLLRAGSRTAFKYSDINRKLRGHQFNEKFHQDDSVVEQRAWINLSGFADRMKKFVTDMRNYFVSRGGRAGMRALGEDGPPM